MNQPASRYVVCEGREIHVAVWGEGHAEKIVMWHGLARTGRDFDELAAHLASRYHVICPDTLGRGLSAWAKDAASEYSFTFYAKLADTLTRHFGFERFHWVGTSMGGALGLRLAGTQFKDRIRRLVINDIGPELPAPAVERILTYASKPPTFETVGELEAWLRTIYKPFGFLTGPQWRRMTETSARRTDDGRVTVHYDPRMTRQLSDHPDDYRQWAIYDRIAAPVLVLRGAVSDLLLPEMAAEMTRRGPKARVMEFAGIGHAPALNVPDQIGPVTAFLAEG
ncbi:MAG: alpha/beta hydrolase [Alphaproteobacteria bacterium]|nr:alpha/beta hydrolase [Alphaproteobacteria bacterium]